MSTKNNALKLALDWYDSGSEVREEFQEMSYVQIFNYLIYFYIKHNTEPRTQWK